jgi:N-acyl-D-amino-acid deacylase
MKILILVIFVLSCSQKKDISQTFPMIDVLIENAQILDGSGSKAVKSNVYIKDDKIVFVGEADHEKLDIKKRIDATEYHLAPGFIDLHAHGNPAKTSDFTNFLSMGVTTIVLGQDGFSPTVDQMERYLKGIDSMSVGTNLAMFIGHGSMRRVVGAEKEATQDQINEMKRLLEQALPYTFGMSTGLEYSPAIHAEETELIELSKIVGQHNRMIMSHMRNEDDDQLNQSIEELIRQGEHTQVHISHLKSVYGKGVNRAEEIIQIIHDAHKKGVKITADVYPYTASYTGIGIVFPKWAKTQTDFEIAKRDRRNELEEFIRNKVTKRNGPEATLFGTNPYVGKTLADLQREKEKPFEKILIDEIGPSGASAAYFVMNDELQNRLIQDDLIGISSDGSPTMHHPRGHGSFAKIIEDFVVKHKLMTLEQAIQKMTSFPASILGIENRGLIKTGNKADIILFKPEHVKANATFPDPRQLSAGFDVVIVNGQIVIENGKRLDLNTGRVLYPVN